MHKPHTCGVHTHAQICIDERAVDEYVCACVYGDSADYLSKGHGKCKGTITLFEGEVRDNEQQHIAYYLTVCVVLSSCCCCITLYFATALGEGQHIVGRRFE